jgi:hypothetical protein
LSCGVWRERGAIVEKIWLGILLKTLETLRCGDVAGGKHSRKHGWECCWSIEEACGVDGLNATENLSVDAEMNLEASNLMELSKTAGKTSVYLMKIQNIPQDFLTNIENSFFFLQLPPQP